MRGLLLAWGRLLVTAAVVAALGACGGEALPGTSVRQSPATAPAGTSDTTGGVEGTARVLIDETTTEFDLTRCTVAADALVVDGSRNDQVLTIRHASPPTRQPPEPAMSVFVVENGGRLEAPPAAVVFDAYDVDAGHAAGSTPVHVGGPSGPELLARFDVRCEGR